MQAYGFPSSLIHVLKHACRNDKGTLMEKIRTGGAGIPAFFTPVGYGTLVQKGGMPLKYNADGSLALESNPKEGRNIGGINCIMEEAITGEFALIKAWKADRAGNLIFRKTARNSNPTMSKAGKITIAEVEEIVETGTIAEDDVHIPHVFVQRIIKGFKYRKPKRRAAVKSAEKQNYSLDHQMTDRILKRAALEVKDGMYINLGCGLPSLVRNYIKPDSSVFLQSDIGALELGPLAKEENDDPDFVDEAGRAATCIGGSSFFATDESFAMSRGVHLDLTILGAMEVSECGDLANWIVPGKMVTGMGGDMDRVSHKNTKVIIAMEHTSRDGKPKILKDCTLPLTAEGCVNMVITEMGVFEISEEFGLLMTEIGDGFSVDDVKKATGCEVKISPGLRAMQTEETKFYENLMNTDYLPFTITNFGISP